MMLLPVLQNTTPDTISYLILGYVIIGGIGLGYVLSMWYRQRALKRDIEMIDRLQSTEGE